MAKEKLVLKPLAKEPEEEYVEIRVPASTFHTFNVIAERGEDPELIEYTNRRRNMKTAFYNDELFAMPDIYADRGNPRGKVTAGELRDSRFFPGTSHSYWVYVPAQYDPEKPANLILFYDGCFNIVDMQKGVPLDPSPTSLMLDNLIADGELPVSIALFVNFGIPGPGELIKADFGFESSINRSVEYDTTSDWNARFITEEVMPIALEGLSVSADPADHAVCGISSSGSAAFTTAWFKPEYFGKVYTASASLVNLRNGIIWPYAVRASAKKDLKIFSVVGKYDMDSAFGNWLSSNYAFGAALHSREYEYRFYLTDGGHSIHVYFCLLPAALLWLFTGKEMAEQEHIRRLTFEETLIGDDEEGSEYPKA